MIMLGVLVDERLRGTWSCGIGTVARLGWVFIGRLLIAPRVFRAVSGGPLIRDGESRI
jgi:hypothetical protein